MLIGWRRVVFAVILAAFVASCSNFSGIGVMGRYYERDQLLAQTGANNSFVSMAEMIQVIDAELQSAMPAGYTNVEVVTQENQNWMTISFRNKTIGEEYWRLAIQFHRVPDENGPQVVSRLRVVYTEDSLPDDKFDTVFHDVAHAIETVTSDL